MDRFYIAHQYTLNKVDACLIWYDESRKGVPDGVVLDEAGRIPVFSDLAHLQAWSDSQNLPVSIVNSRTSDLDALQEWLQQPDADEIDCSTFLDVWNLFIDIQASLENRHVLREDTKKTITYDKLFWGNNLPSLTPEGKSYEPIWSSGEVQELQGVFQRGLQMFQSHIHLIA